MRDFIIIFEGKEGTSPLVKLLNNFDRISIVQLVNNAGWEPFDRHNCGPMSLGDLERCLDIAYDKESTDIKQLNQGRTRIHCIEFGDGPPPSRVDPDNWLHRLARDNGGTYRYCDVNQLFGRDQ